MLRRRAEDRDDDRQPNHDLGGGDRQHRKTNIQPSTELRKCANAMNERFTALSISSMDMNMISGLRRTSTPTRADGEEQRADDQIGGEWHRRTLLAPYSSPASRTAAQDHRAQHRDHQQQARDLERERVAVEERQPERLGVAESPPASPRPALLDASGCRVASDAP